jgi:hypothetical protein
MLSKFQIPQPGTKILLINTHAYDVRLPWVQWHQPVGLMQLGTLLKAHECDVRLIDCLQWDQSPTLPRRKIGTVNIENYEIDIWCFGTPWEDLNNHINYLKGEKWLPDQVYVSCFQTHWWQAARDVIQQVKNKWFPDAQVFLGGIYANLESEHALINSGADIVINEPVSEKISVLSDISLYPEQYRPSFAGLFLYNADYISRSPEEIANEVLEKSKKGVREFAFFDDNVLIDNRTHFKHVLREIAHLNLDIRFIGLGNISPELIDGETARSMHQAGYRQVYLKSNVSILDEHVSYSTPYESYMDCVQALQREGRFKPRSGDVTAMLQVGNPYENIEAVTEHLIKLSSIVGVVSLVQYQHSKDFTSIYSADLQNAVTRLSLVERNCKFYPIARLMGIPFEYYVELTRLAALLSSKYRNRTFNFLEDSLIANIVRQSIKSQSWKPFSNGAKAGDSEIIPLLPFDENE